MNYKLSLFALQLLIYRNRRKLYAASFNHISVGGYLSKAHRMWKQKALKLIRQWFRVEARTERASRSSTSGR